MARYSTRKKSGYRSKRGYASSGRRRSYSKMARRAGRKLKFATVGFKRDTEKKYFDKAIWGHGGTLVASITGASSTKSAGFASSGWRYTTNPGAVAVSTANTYVQDLFKGLPQGTNATSRIGNVVNVKYVKGNITLTANTVANASTGYENAQFGEGVVEDTAGALTQYLRTTYRVVILRDLQVNSAATGVTWGEVFSNLDGTSGVHSEMNVANMGRFNVLVDKLVHLDADDPQKTMPFIFRNMGRVRYNGPQADGAQSALTDTGLYIVWACVTAGVTGPTEAAKMTCGGVNVNSRMCFTDC